MARPEVECPSCGKKPTEIRASHDYTIWYDEVQGRWVKETGQITYTCGLCLEELDVRVDIRDVLKQVDEL